MFSHVDSLFFWLLSISSWLSLSLAETSGNEVGGHAKCAGWSWLPWSTVQNRSGWRSNGQRDGQKSLYSWVDVTSVLLFHQAKSGQWKKGEGKVYFERWKKGLQPSIWRCEVLKLLPPLCAARSLGPQGDQDMTRFHGFHAEDLALFLYSTPRTSLRDVSKYWSK